MSGPDLTYHLLFAVQGTADAVRQGRKDVTRRLAKNGGCRWRVGAWARCYERDPRVGGRSFGLVKILDVRRERASAIASYTNELEREGFPNLSVEEFHRFFLVLHSLDSSADPEVWRIVFGPLRQAQEIPNG
jgi:hypothetical protein